MWVKISDRLPEKDHNYHVKATSRYQGYNHNDTAWWRNGAWEFQQSNRGYYVVEWLDEGTAAGRGDDGVALFEELWDEHSEYIDDDIDSLSRWAGSTVVDKEQFKTIVAKLYELFKQQKEK